MHGIEEPSDHHLQRGVQRLHINGVGHVRAAQPQRVYLLPQTVGTPGSERRGGLLSRNGPGKLTAMLG